MIKRLQNITFEYDILHVRGKSTAKTAAGQPVFRQIEFDKEDTFSTDTYFGALSVGKWVRYTGVDNVLLKIRTLGKYRLKVIHAYLSGNDGRLLLNEVKKADIDVFKPTEIAIDVPAFSQGIIYFSVDEVRDHSIIFEAHYDTEISDGRVRDIRLALNICTYKRTEALSANVIKIKNELLDAGNASEDFSSRLELFITDNASELPYDKFDDDRIHINHNYNLGGAGGFTKGLLEILKHTARQQITHCVFMDDDALISIEGIKRTFNLLALLKDEYLKHFISGAMNMAENIGIQHENGALWNRGKCVFINRGLDMSILNNLLLNEADYERDYAAWWYCCVPMSAVREDNLPIPIFIHGDDVEYSLRNASGIITMNGIAVWHPASMHRRTSVNEYYNLRNMLIVNSRHLKGYSIGSVYIKVFSAMAVALTRHRYRDMKLVIRAVCDYLKGPYFLMNTDAEALNSEIVKLGYSLKDVSDELKRKNNIKCYEHYDAGKAGFKHEWSAASSLGRVKLIMQLISLNGWLLPRKKSTEIHYMNVHPVKLFRCGRIVLFDDADNKGLILDKKFGQLLIMIIDMIYILFVLLLKYYSARKAYINAWGEMTSADFWKRVVKEDK